MILCKQISTYECSLKQAKNYGPALFFHYADANEPATIMV